MPEVQEIVTYNDCTLLKLNKDDFDFRDKRVGYFRQTAKFKIRGLKGFKWWILWYASGRKSTDKGHISVFLKTDTAVKASYQFAIPGSSIRLSNTGVFLDPLTSEGCSRYASHKQVLPLFHHDILTIRCRVKFLIPVKRDLLMPSMYQLFGHVSTDVELVVGDSVVPAHKSFLSLISPVFNAMFSHNTTEAKSNRVKITDFDFVSVQSAIDYCYGQKLNTISAEIGIKMLRFYDKYGITAVIEELERLATLIPSTKNFCQIVRYAYDCNRDAMMTDCCKFFEDHQDQIKVSAEFAQLPPLLVGDILKKAFDLETENDVLQHAQMYGISFVVDFLEERLFNKSMSIDNFCAAVKYAWKWTRKELQQACAKYFNDNREVITDLPDFIKLPYEAMQGILKTSHDLKRSMT